MTLSGKAAVAGVMGWPVEHSLSPRLHGYWLEQHDIEGAYVPLAVKPEHFRAAVKGLANMGFRGVNLTIPHKEAALEACDEVDDLARRIGAVNTIVMTGGRLKGTNSDGFGFRENLRQGAPGWEPAAAPAVVLGAGGAARAVVTALADAGVPEVRLCNRSKKRAKALRKALGDSMTILAWEMRAEALDGAGLLVNTTSLGMVDQPELDIDLSRLPANALVTDIVYTPLETALLSRARRRGNLAVDGLGMLLHQARPGFKAWFGVAPEVTPELRAFVLAGQR